MEIKPMEIVKIGTVFAIYGEQGELIIADRDKAVVEAALRAHKTRPRAEPEPEKATTVAEAWELPPQEGEVGVVSYVPEEGADEDEKEEPLPDLAGLSYRELKAIAKELEIPHYQRMKREDLQAAIEQLMTEAEAEPGAGTEF